MRGGLNGALPICPWRDMWQDSAAIPGLATFFTGAVGNPLKQPAMAELYISGFLSREIVRLADVRNVWCDRVPKDDPQPESSEKSPAPL